MFTDECADLIKILMIRNPYERLGVHEGAKELKSHKWFADVDWQEVYDKNVYMDKIKPKPLRDRRNEIIIEQLVVVDRVDRMRIRY